MRITAEKTIFDYAKSHADSLESFKEWVRTTLNFLFMVKLKNEVEYNWAMARIEELLPFVTDETPEDDAMYIELNVLSDLVSDYEEIHYNVENLTIKDGIVVEKKKNIFDRHKKSFSLRTTLPRKKKKLNAYSSALKKSAGNKLTFSLAK